MDLPIVKKMTPQGKFRRELLLGLILGMAATFVPIGCGIIEERDYGFSGLGSVQRWPRRAWSEAFVLQTPHYTMRTNTSPDVAVYIGKLMERAFTGYREVLGCRDVSLPSLTINAYATRKEYDAVARRLGLSAGITTGLYTPVPPAAIHLPYTKDLRGHPSRTLLHEGTHQFVDQAVRFLVPPAARSTLPPAKHKLMSVPLWLNEGLATYMESAAVTEEELEIGRINRTRLVHLQRLIRTRKCPPLREVLSRRYSEPFLAKDYAVAWGIVYTLRHAPDACMQAEGRKRLSRYLDACRQAFYTEPVTEFLRDFLPGGSPVEDFDRLWAEHIGRHSLEAFERIIVGEGSTLEAWERDWTAHILRLDFP